jgi:hypothetical protein
MMTKDKAREMLERHFGIDFPIHDKIIDEIWCNENTLNVTTFRWLLKIAYNLEDKKETK